MIACVRLTLNQSIRRVARLDSSWVQDKNIFFRAACKPSADSSQAAWFDSLYAALRWIHTCRPGLIGVCPPLELNLHSVFAWFSSNDAEGRVYYFEENSSESSWTLPSTVSTSFSENSVRPENLASAPGLGFQNLAKMRGVKFTFRILGVF
ncbi:hypothetical protein ACFE04_019824 [Oxalis oulophora]